jgi:hypothetical protein
MLFPNVTLPAPIPSTDGSIPSSVCAGNGSTCATVQATVDLPGVFARKVGSFSLSLMIDANLNGNFFLSLTMARVAASFFLKRKIFEWELTLAQ